MRYVVEYIATGIDSLSKPKSNRIVVLTNSLPHAIHEAIEYAKRRNQKILEITNYYWLDDDEV